MKLQIALTAFVVTLTASAAVPLRWTVETSRVQPAQIEAYHGETLRFEAALQSYGKPFALTNNLVAIYWQTNGMDTAYWVGPAVISNHVLLAEWVPAMDVGATVYQGFIGAPGEIYRASFQLRLRPSPGAVPSELPLPVRAIDFAQVEVRNAPYYTQDETDATVDGKIASAVAPLETAVHAAATYQPVISDLATIRSGAAAGATALQSYTETDPTVPSWAKATSKPSYTWPEIGSKPSWIGSTKPTYTAAEVGALERSWQDESYGPTVVLLKRTMSNVTSPLFKATETPGPGSTIYSWYAEGFTVPWSKVTGAPAIPTDEHINDVAVAAAADKADASTVEALSVAVNEANAWAQGTFNFLSGNTNAWFAGTNYVTGADITNKMHFAIEDGMDLLTMPCSMALWENRDGQRGCVWDQRDWTAWYWKFKSQQMMAQVAASNDVIRAEMASDENHAWAKHYASSGRVNPDASTTYIDTKRVCLSPGMAWETVADVNGAAYWTIVGDGAVIGGSGTNAVLEIKDFEGNAIMTVTKGQHQLAYLEAGDFTGQMRDGNGWVCFDMLANVQPTGFFSTTLGASDFVVETDANCPAQYQWELVSPGRWRIHFLLKPGIESTACFAKFLVEVQGQTVVRFAAGMNIEGGLIYGGKKIVPVIPVGAQAGDTITWKVAQ